MVLFAPDAASSRFDRADADTSTFGSMTQKQKGPPIQFIV